MTIKEIVAIIGLMVFLWAWAEGYIQSIINWMFENPLLSLIIILIILFGYGYLRDNI